ncbi:MAG: siroheme synthase/precorrin-2 oxidase (MET8) [Cenarchaeum symbiont of Oopsacas minuta]|nr:siroheme synthase/precorrin-2 oxidase (MET8) [Cenarchaeum symbiont of Oopsacas minuta]
MIVDLYLKGGLVIIVGTGAEGLKKINSLLTQDCEILVIGKTSNPIIEKHIKAKEIEFIKADLDDGKFLLKYKPVLVMATTNDRKLNCDIVKKARKIPGCMVYASDDPDFSDFSHPSVINIRNTVQVTVSTSGKSPAMAREIRMRAEKPLNALVTKEDIVQINLQHTARMAAKRSISNQTMRKKYLYAVMRDSEVIRLIKQDRIKMARNRAMDMLKEFE